MADSKLTALTELATAAGTDILYIVDDPAGTPLSRKVTIDTILTYVKANTASTDLTDTDNIAYLNTANTYAVSVAQDFNGNTIDNFGVLNSNAADVATTGVINLGNEQQIAFRDKDNDGDVTLRMRTNDTLEFTGDAFNMQFLSTTSHITYTINRAQVVSNGGLLGQIDIRGQNDATASRVYARERFTMEEDDQTVLGLKAGWELHVAQGGSAAAIAFSADGVNKRILLASAWNLELASGNITIGTGELIQSTGGGNSGLSFATTDVVKTLINGAEQFNVSDDAETPIIGKFGSKAGDLVVGDLTDGYFTVAKNSTSGEVKLYVNDGGTIKSVELTA